MKKQRDWSQNNRENFCSSRTFWVAGPYHMRERGRGRREEGRESWEVWQRHDSLKYHHQKEIGPILYIHTYIKREKITNLPPTHKRLGLFPFFTPFTHLTHPHPHTPTHRDTPPSQPSFSIFLSFFLSFKRKLVSASVHFFLLLICDSPLPPTLVLVLVYAAWNAAISFKNWWADHKIEW